MFTFCFLRVIHERYLLLKDVNDEQIKFANELKYIDKVVKPVEKWFFLNNIAFFLSVREKVLNSFRNELFPIKYLDTIPTTKTRTRPRTWTKAWIWIKLEPRTWLKLEPELELELEPDRKLEPEPKPESKPEPILKNRKHPLK